MLNLVAKLVVFVACGFISPTGLNHREKQNFSDFESSLATKPFP